MEGPARSRKPPLLALHITTSPMGVETPLMARISGISDEISTIA